MGRKPIDSEIKNRIADDLREGMTRKDIAQKYGVSCTSVANISKANGIPFRQKFAKRDAEILKLASDGEMTIVEIADRMGISREVVRKVCVNNNGLPIYERTCLCCGEPFETFMRYKVYCSKQCERREARQRDTWKKRIRRRSTRVLGDKTVTLQSVYRHFDGICQICGKPCDWNDCDRDENNVQYTHKMYPSVDHIVPLVKGGTHTWDNVQLAHVGCNSRKGAQCGTD